MVDKDRGGAPSEKKVKIIFVETREGQDKVKTEVMAPCGISLLEVTRRNDIDLEGACEGSLACSTCHVIVSEPWFSQLPEATVMEEDMLDLAQGLTMTSRLGCQIIVGPELEGMEVEIPPQTRNLKIPY